MLAGQAVENRQGEMNNHLPHVCVLCGGCLLDRNQGDAAVAVLEAAGGVKRRARHSGSKM